MPIYDREHIHFWVQESIRLSRQRFNQEVGISIESLKTAESVLSKIARLVQQHRSESREVVRKVSFSFGILIGEIMRRELGGKWIISVGGDIPHLLMNGVRVFPIEYVRDRLLDREQRTMEEFYLETKKKLPDQGKFIRQTRNVHQSQSKREVEHRPTYNTKMQLIVGGAALAMLVILFVGGIIVVSQMNTDVPPQRATIGPITLPPTWTPEWTSGLNFEDVLIRPGDLPSGIVGGQVRAHVPAMFDGIVEPDYEIYQPFERNGAQDGGVAVLVYSDEERVKEAYEFILEGMGGRDADDILIGKDVAVNTVVLPFSDEVMTDIVWRDCYSVVHIRMGATPDVAVEYGHRLITRLSKFVCR